MGVEISLTFVALALGLLGLFVGLIGGLLWSRRGFGNRFSSESIVDPENSLDTDEQLPDSLRQSVDVLRLLRTAWIICDADDLVVVQSSSAATLGLVRDLEVVSTDMLETVRAVRADGEARELQFSVARGPHNAGALDISARIAMLGQHTLVLAEDRTASKRVEATRRDFVVNVSHELKTPIGGLRLLAETMEVAANDPEAVLRFSRRMQTEVMRLTNLVQEIVDLSRLQGSDTIESSTPVDMRECAQEAVEVVQLLAEDRSITITVQGKPGQIVSGDAGMLGTAIRNLLMNAVNYSDPGNRVVVSVETRFGADSYPNSSSSFVPGKEGHTQVADGRTDAEPGLLAGPIVEIRVTDEGMGMSPDELHRVFERFYRVDPARSRQTGGTGLGLAIVKHICANHGGTVTVWSEPGIGSTFTLRLPAARQLGIPPAMPSPIVHTTESSPETSQFVKEHL